MIRFTIVPDVIAGAGAASISAAAPLVEAARRLAGDDTNALAVTDEAGRLSGLVDAGAIVRAIAEDGAAALERPVAAVARPAPDLLAPDDSGLDALELMRLRAVDHLAVMGADGRLLGIVSRRHLCDLLHRCLDSEFDRLAKSVFDAPDGTSGDAP